MRMLIKNLNIKSLVTGDKQARITLETLYPKDIPTLAMLSDITEIEVEFKVSINQEIFGNKIEIDKKEKKE